jgi:hypothetical protein
MNAKSSMAGCLVVAGGIAGVVCLLAVASALAVYFGTGHSRTYEEAPADLGGMKQAKDDCEAKAILLKDMHVAGSVSQDVFWEAQRRYAEVSSKFNGCMYTMCDALDYTMTEDARAKLQRRLEVASKDYNDFVIWCDRYLHGTRTSYRIEDFTEVIPKVIDAYVIIYNDYSRSSQERRRLLIERIRSCEFRPWHELPVAPTGPDGSLVPVEEMTLRKI